MVTAETVGAVRAALLRALADGPSGAMLYMVLDAAHHPRIYEKLSELGDDIQAGSLYQGDIGASLADVSPYLLRLRDPEDEAWSFVAAGHGRSWGIFLVTAAEFADVRRHLRKFNVVYREDATPLVFRFHDPRVLRRFLPTCTPDELRRLFGPIDAFLAESEEADALIRLTFRGEELTETRLPLSSMTTSDVNPGKRTF
jgi:hypothetical protein